MVELLEWYLLPCRGTLPWNPIAPIWPPLFMDILCLAPWPLEFHTLVLGFSVSNGRYVVWGGHGEGEGRGLGDEE